MRSHFPIFCLYTRSNFSFMETVKMSFHSPTLPATQTRVGRAEFTRGHASCQTTRSRGEGPGRFQTYSRSPLNLSCGDHDSHVNYRLAEPASLSLAIPVCFPPRTTNVKS